MVPNEFDGRLNERMGHGAINSDPEPDGGEPANTSDQVLEFELVANGVDFLDSAIQHLSASDDPRSLKYTVLHLQAAVEIMVKVRLRREGFEHIFTDPYSADENKLKHGQVPQRVAQCSNDWIRLPGSA